MPRYIAIRDCFTYDRFHYKGKTYELPPNAQVSPKNFSPVDVAPVAVAAPAIELSTAAKTTEITAETPKVIETPKAKKAGCKCSVCGKVVRTRLALAGHSRSHKKEKDVSSNKTTG